MTEESGRTVPYNDLDYNLMLSTPEWGRDDIPLELREHLSEVLGEAEIEGKDGKVTNQTIYRSLWGLLGMYTRDVRLGNLSRIWGEVNYVQYYLNLAGDCLRAGYIRAFLKSLSEAVTVLEVSQSAGGFLRKRQGTVTYEQHSKSEEPGKQGLFGKKKMGYENE